MVLRVTNISKMTVSITETTITPGNVAFIINPGQRELNRANSLQSLGLVKIAIIEDTVIEEAPVVEEVSEEVSEEPKTTRRKTSKQEG